MTTGKVSVADVPRGDRQIRSLRLIKEELLPGREIGGSGSIVHKATWRESFPGSYYTTFVFEVKTASVIIHVLQALVTKWYISRVDV